MSIPPFENVCIDSNAFIFNSGCVRAKKSKQRKHKKYSNILKPKCCIFELHKSKFASTSLGVSTSIDNAWSILLENLLNMYDGNFLISLTNCDSNCKTIHHTYSKLKKYTISPHCNKIKLYFTFNINPMENNQICMDGKCLQFNIDAFYNLDKKEYCNIQFWHDKNYIYSPIK
jgi:hypothetical protein